MAEAQDNNKSVREVLRERKHVQEVCSGWKIYEDSAYAHEVQQEEIQNHYDSNRYQRRVVRDDLHLAKELQTKEDILRREKQNEEQRENEATLRKMLEAQKLSADQDELISKDEEYARRLQEKYEKRLEERKRRWEEKRRLKEKEATDSPKYPEKPEPVLHGAANNETPPNEEDEELARRLQAEEVARAREEQVRLEAEIRARHASEQEMLDAHVARLLHEREKEKLRRLQEKQRMRKLRKQAEANSSIEAPTLPSKSSQPPVAVAGCNNNCTTATTINPQSQHSQTSLPPPSFPAPKLDALTSRMVAQNQVMRQSSQASSSSASSASTSSHMVTASITNSFHPTPSLIEAHPEGPLSTRPEHTYQNLASLSSKRLSSKQSIDGQQSSPAAAVAKSNARVKENLEGLNRHLSAGDPLHNVPMNYKRSTRH